MNSTSRSSNTIFHLLLYVHFCFVYNGTSVSHCRRCHPQLTNAAIMPEKILKLKFYVLYKFGIYLFTVQLLGRIVYVIFSNIKRN